MCRGKIRLLSKKKRFKSDFLLGQTFLTFVRFDLIKRFYSIKFIFAIKYPISNFFLSNFFVSFLKQRRACRKE